MSLSDTQVVVAKRPPVAERAVGMFMHGQLHSHRAAQGSFFWAIYILYGRLFALEEEKLIHAGGEADCAASGRGKFEVHADNQAGDVYDSKLRGYFGQRAGSRVSVWGSTAGVTLRSEIMLCSLTAAVTIDSSPLTYPLPTPYQSHTCDSNVKSRKCVVNCNQFRLCVRTCVYVLRVYLYFRCVSVRVYSPPRAVSAPLQ